jgi:hypothetical protein
MIEMYFTNKGYLMNYPMLYDYAFSSIYGEDPPVDIAPHR